MKKERPTPRKKTANFFDYENFFVPKVIPSKYLKFRPLSLPDPLDEDKTLRALIPGRYYFSHEDDTLRLIAWKCKTKSTKKGVWDLTDSSAFPVPDTAFNQTKVSQLSYMKSENGTRYAVLVFGTCNQNEIYPEGRFSCAYMGIAIFQQNGKSWDLQYFDPFTGCVGQFAHVPELHPIKISTNTFLYYYMQPTSGFGTYEANLEVGGIIHNKLVNLATQEETENNFGNYDSTISWTSKIEIDSLDKSECPDLSIITEGKVLSPKKLDTGNYTLPYLPKELLKTFHHSKKPSLDFKYKTQYHFQNNEYKRIKQGVVEVG